MRGNGEIETSKPSARRFGKMRDADQLTLIVSREFGNYSLRPSGGLIAEIQRETER
jgi:hypothetical protein